MKSLRLLVPLVALLVGIAAFAEAAPKGRLVPAAEKDAAWVEKAKAAYPLKKCVVSDEELGGMGDAVDCVYESEGRPDRLVRFCCGSCKKDFLKEPEKFLKDIADAAAAGEKPAGHKP